MDWDKLRIFHAVAEAGSFTQAGDVLNLSQSAVSRQVSGLEQSLDMPLFHRHARGLVLTEQGERLYSTTREVANRLSETATWIRESKRRPQGPLKVTTTVAFGAVWLTPRLKEFVDQYREISLGVRLDDSELDLAMRQADVAIRMRPSTQPHLIQRKLMTVRFHPYASQSYLQGHGTPRKPADLDHHAIIVYGEDPNVPDLQTANWLTEAGMPPRKKRRATLTVNNLYGIFRAVQSGLGIGLLPDYMRREAGNLVAILPELQGPELHAHFVYPE